MVGLPCPHPTTTLQNFPHQIIATHDLRTPNTVIKFFYPDLRTHPRHQKNDSLIAAAALVHGLVVATRNVGDFEPVGVKLVNPFAEQ